MATVREAPDLSCGVALPFATSFSRGRRPSAADGVIAPWLWEQMLEPKNRGQAIQAVEAIADDSKRLRFSDLRINKRRGIASLVEATRHAIRRSGKLPLDPRDSTSINEEISHASQGGETSTDSSYTPNIAVAKHLRSLALGAWWSCIGACQGDASHLGVVSSGVCLTHVRREVYIRVLCRIAQLIVPFEAANSRALLLVTSPEEAAEENYRQDAQGRHVATGVSRAHFLSVTLVSLSRAWAPTPHGDSELFALKHDIAFLNRLLPLVFDTATVGTPTSFDSALMRPSPTAVTPACPHDGDIRTSIFTQRVTPTFVHDATIKRHGMPARKNLRCADVQRHARQVPTLEGLEALTVASRPLPRHLVHLMARTPDIRPNTPHPNVVAGLAPHDSGRSLPGRADADPTAAVHLHCARLSRAPKRLYWSASQTKTGEHVSCDWRLKGTPINVAAREETHAICDHGPAIALDADNDFTGDEPQTVAAFFQLLEHAAETGTLTVAVQCSVRREKKPATTLLPPEYEQVANQTVHLSSDFSLINIARMASPSSVVAGHVRRGARVVQLGIPLTSDGLRNVIRLVLEPEKALLLRKCSNLTKHRGVSIDQRPEHIALDLKLTTV
jgi:hypothetical protein